MLRMCQLPYKFSSIGFSMKRYVLPALILAVLSSSEAWAHSGHGAATGFMSGFAHPFSGLDHVLAMTAVGLWAGGLGRRETHLRGADLPQYCVSACKFDPD